jgi:hypothetical protein
MARIVVLITVALPARHLSRRGGVFDASEELVFSSSSMVLANCA